MPIEVHISRFDKSLNERPISINEWQNCVNEIENVEFNNGENKTFRSIETLNKSGEKIPIFWIHEEHGGFMRVSGFFAFEESLETAIKIAEHLNAFIYFDEGEILYHPNYGILPDYYGSSDVPELTLDELSQNNLIGKEVNKYIIDQYLKQKQELINRKERNANLFEQRKRKQKWWQFWK